MKNTLENIVNRTKVAVNDLQNHSFSEFQKKLPAFINRNLGYSLLDNIFSREEGISIKEYFTGIKREKANELLNHYHLNANEVAYQLGYKQPGRIYRMQR